MKLFIRLLLSSHILITSYVHCVGVYKGNSDDPTVTFETALNSCVFHVPTQTLYVGLDNNSGNYSLTKISTTYGNTTALATTTGNTQLANTFINNLALSVDPAKSEMPLIICTSSTGQNALPTAVYAVNATGNQVTTSGDLNDATGNATTGGIVNVAASGSHVFAAVLTGGATTSFGSGASDGIAAVKIDRTTQALTKLDATTGDTDSNKALAVTDTLEQLTAYSGEDVTFATTYTPALCWCEALKTLYIGVQVTAAANPGKAMSVLTAKIDPTTNILSFVNSVEDYGAVVDDNNLIVATTNGESVTAAQLAVMETSTGFFYLIVQGGNNIAEDTNNLVYAIPLVSGDEVDETILGTFAKADLTTDDFTEQASQANHLFTNTNVAALVGNGGYPEGAIKVLSAPIENDTDRGISSLFVSGDTVYISIASQNDPDQDNAPGVYYSQAIFNEMGKIQSWTSWAKAAPFESGVSATNGSTQNVFVNALTGHIITVDQSKTIVNTTQWRAVDPDNQNALLNILNETFQDGCFSCCDINHTTFNFANINAQRYALFGGRGKVAVARIGQANKSYDSVITTLEDDFSSEENFKVLSLPNSTDPVMCLGYSQWLNNNDTVGYFFAGTKNGLYVYANENTQTGFDPSSLDALDQAPFAETFSWQKIEEVNGEVKTIKSAGGSAVYVLTKSINANGTPVDRVYQIKINQVATDFTINLLALSNSNDLSDALLFFDIHIIPTDVDLETSYLILATSAGMYYSADDIDSKANQTQANWNNFSSAITDHIFVPHFTLYPSNFTAHSWSKRNPQYSTFNKAILDQYTIYDENINPVKNPSTSFITTTGTPSYINPLSSYYSDGLRRFMISNSQDNSKSIISILPYQTQPQQWNYNSINRSLTDALFTNSEGEYYYWIYPIGATGNIYVGTSNGVIALG